MRRQRRSRLSTAARGLLTLDRRPWTVDSRLRDTGRPAPLVEHVEHVGLAEVDANGPPPRTTAIVAFEIAVDAGARDLQRYALLRPARHEVERRTGDADQVPVVLATE